MLEKKILKLMPICGLDKNDLPNHLSKLKKEDRCYNSIAPKNCPYSLIDDNLRICKYLSDKNKK